MEGEGEGLGFRVSHREKNVVQSEKFSEKGKEPQSQFQGATCVVSQVLGERFSRGKAEGGESEVKGYLIGRVMEGGRGEGQGLLEKKHIRKGAAR